ncbi:L,D-transpeptidase family protein [Candidatus Woesearchaeota archaeon]|nr:L,D-transpeptidase family protein [Candidatus Woesearchaeota archaeon]
MYHCISNNDNTYLTIKPELLEKQINWLKENNFKTITVDQLVSHIENKTKIPEKSIMLIFDDNYYKSIKYNVIPLLEENGYTAILSLITSGIVEKKSNNEFSYEELIIWENKNLVDVQSHTVTSPLHPNMTEICDKELKYELKESKKILEKKLNKKILGLIWPGGSYNQKTINTAKEAGYKALFTVYETGIITNLDKIGRMQVTKETTFEDFILKIDKFYENKLFCVDTSDQILEVYKNGKKKKTYHVGVGKKIDEKTCTPIGEYTIGFKLFDPIKNQKETPYSKDKNNMFGPVYMGLFNIDGTNTSLGIHGTSDSLEYLLNKDERFISQGCIRLKNKDILKLCTNVEVGDKVIIKD